MFTQCPECGVAFRVTAEVLKMAAGKVRCGGCGVAFNALEHLSEEKPLASAPAEQAPDPDLPELTPDEPAELQADTPPESISAEQSAALLKTLDQLAGEDIRIEDTGVEWRVLDDDEEPEDEQQTDAPSDLTTDTGSMKFVIEGEEDADEPSQVIDEMLFDDNTILPDDFDEVVDAPASAAPAESPPEPEPQPEPPQIDLDLSEPDEWDDLLGDLDEAEEEPEPEPEAEPEPEPAPEIEIAAAEEEDSEDPLDMDTQFAIQAEAMGIDLSGVHDVAEEESAEAEEEPESAGEEELEDDLETSIEEDLMAAAFEAEAAVQKLEETASEEALEPEEEEEASEDVAIDLQLEEEEETEDDVDDIAHGYDDKVEQDIATLSMSLDEDEPEALEEPVDATPTSDDEHVIPEMTEEEKTINMMIDQELFNIAVEDEDGFASTIVQLQPDDKVGEEIEDNKKKSGKKDKKDKKGKQGKKNKDKKKDKARDRDADKESVAEKEPQVAVETIIMEGEFVRGELDKERLAADKKAESGDMAEGGLSIPLNREKDDYARRREITSGPPGTGTYIGIAALVLLLILQVIHQSREALATVPAFSDTVGPVYRMLGQPLTPEWNIAGWRFEATKDDLDETSNVLTIYSRVGNNSDDGLPYPLVHLSLTDRFEDIIGSTVLEPADYLPENADPRKLVPPGNTFNAVISVDSPPENAFGYKLNVCYRLSGGLLRCAEYDFK